MTTTSPIWRHLTHPDGMTVSLLVEATGLPVRQVRAELKALEAAGKAWREHAPVGKEHLWWRYSQRPLDELTIATAMASAADIHAPGKLRAVIQHLSTRAQMPHTRALLAEVAKVTTLRANVRRIVTYYYEHAIAPHEAAA